MVWPRHDASFAKNVEKLAVYGKGPCAGLRRGQGHKTRTVVNSVRPWGQNGRDWRRTSSGKGADESTTSWDEEERWSDA